VASASPAGSSRRAGAWLSVNIRPPTATSASPAGTFSQNTRCQAIPSTIAPPTTGPNPTEIPVIALTPRPPCRDGTVDKPR